MNTQVDSLRYQNNRKSVGVTYLLWILLGAFGVHRMYLNNGGAVFYIFGWLALVFTSLCLVAGTVPIIYVGLLVFSLTGFFLVDALLIPGMVTKYNDDLLNKMIGDAPNSSADRQRPGQRLEPTF